MQEVTKERSDLMGHSLGEGSLDFEAVKTADCSSASAVAARVVETALNQNTKDYLGGSIPCICGGSFAAAIELIQELSGIGVSVKRVVCRN